MFNQLNREGGQHIVSGCGAMRAADCVSIDLAGGLDISASRSNTDNMSCSIDLEDFGAPSEEQQQR